jgi:hypothetical protein
VKELMRQTQPADFPAQQRCKNHDALGPAIMHAAACNHLPCFFLETPPKLWKHPTLPPQGASTTTSNMPHARCLTTYIQLLLITQQQKLHAPW